MKFLILSLLLCSFAMADSDYVDTSDTLAESDTEIVVEENIPVSDEMQEGTLEDSSTIIESDEKDSDE